jgi:hypothetical protein
LFACEALDVFTTREAAAKRSAQAQSRQIEAEWLAANEAERERGANLTAALERRQRSEKSDVQKRVEETVKENRRWRISAKLEMPVVGGLGILIVAGGMALGGSTGLCLGAAFVGGLSGFGLCWKTRARRRRRAEEELVHLTSEHRKALANLEKQTNKSLQQLEEGKNKRLAEARAPLETLAEQRKSLKKQLDTEMKKICEDRDKAIQRIRKTASSASEELQRRLLNLGETKRESAKTGYEPYVRTKANGYRDGSEPSRSEAEMTYSEREQAKTQLQMAALFRGRL